VWSRYSFSVAYVPGLPGAHTKAETLEELQVNLRETASLVLESAPQATSESHFVDTQLVTIDDFLQNRQLVVSLI